MQLQPSLTFDDPKRIKDLAIGQFYQSFRKYWCLTRVLVWTEDFRNLMCSIYIFLLKMKDGNVTSHKRKMNLVIWLSLRLAGNYNY